ncbi:MAG: nucleoside deaminase [Spirochaetales bacterium]|nr:nucleoside deaminase [Spirochaetales bacterium]
MNTHEQFMAAAAAEAEKGLALQDGGPFGAVIVKDGRIIAAAHNEVIKINDPTAHAEINAIRKASALLGRFDLSDCTIYSSCEPCPMCFAAIHWAKMTKLYFGCTRKDAASIGFDDNFIYEVIQGKAVTEQVNCEQTGRELCLPAFEKWKNLDTKTAY